MKNSRSTKNLIRLLLLTSLFLSACAGSVDETTSTTAAITTDAPTTLTTALSPAPTGDIVDVAAENFAFVPSEVTIKVGDSVRWSLVSGAHTTTSGNPDFSWDQTITADTPVVVTFDQAGDFIYFCSFHGDQMSGRVVVEP